MRSLSWFPSSLYLLAWTMLESPSVHAFSSSTLRQSRTPILINSSPNDRIRNHANQQTILGSAVVEDVETTETNTASFSSMPRGAHAPVVEINSPLELADFLNQDDRICVIKFHASWCKTCQRAGLKFQSFANNHGDWYKRAGLLKNRKKGELIKEGDYRFASIEMPSNLGMCELLEISHLPAVHLYQSQTQLAGFPCGPTKFQTLKEKLEHHTQQSTADPSTPTTFTPKLLEKMIALEASGKLKSRKK